MQQFSEKELASLKKRYLLISNKGEVTYQKFKDSMGILGLDHATFLIDRPFFTQNQYINYLQLVMYGTDVQKSELSFAFIDSQRKGYIEYKEFQRMMLDLTLFWNQITGSRVTPRQNYISNLWDQFECERLDFPQFFQKFEIVQSTIDWFEYFNESEILTQTSPQNYREVILLSILDQFQNEIRNCVNLLSEHEKNKRPSLDESFVQGPCNFSTSQIAKDGDEDPSFEISFLSNLKTNSISFSNSSNHPLDQIEAKIEYLQQLIEQAGKLPETQDNQNIYATSRQSLQRKRNTIKSMPSRKAKQKLSVYFGHENWNLILNLMIGMKMALTSLQPEFYGSKILKTEFSERYVYDILQNRSNNFDYRKAYLFKDYAPSIFFRIRKLFQINNSDYQRSVGPENLIGNLVFGKLDSLTELGSTGKSGSFFYYTQDCQYMIKTISEDEANLLRRILPKYYFHLKSHPNTLLSRIFGFHQLKIFKSKNEVQKIYLITQVNLFRSGIEIDFRYDIKGSLYGRQTELEKQKLDNTIAFKDLDLLQRKDLLNLQTNEKKLLKQTLIEDSQFLKDSDIIDYSLLIGYHKRDQKRLNQYGFPIKSNQNPFENFEGGILSEDREWIYFIGIIDILTFFNTKKLLEYGIKSTLVSHNISCVPPANYADRFVQFIDKNLLSSQTK